MTKKEYKEENAKKFAISSLSSPNTEHSLTEARRACEAICRAIILQHFGETRGEKIILGEITEDGNPGHRFPDGSFRTPLLDKLLNICRSHIPEPCYYRLQDIRFGGNNASHDPINTKTEITQNDIELCIAQFKEVIKWFWTAFLQKPIPEEIYAASNAISIGSFSTSNSVWSDLLQKCNFFSREQKHILIAPPEFTGIDAAQLESLGRVNWQLVIDFDPSSKESGLYNAISESLQNKHLHHVTVEQISDKGLVSDSKVAVNWVFANGIISLPNSITNTERDWRKKGYNSLLKRVSEEYFSTKVQDTLVLILYNEINYVKSALQVFDEYANPDLTKYVLIYSNLDLEARLHEEFDQYDVSCYQLTGHEFLHGISTTIDLKNNQTKPETFVIPARENETDLPKDIGKKYYSFKDRFVDVVYQGIENAGISGDIQTPFFKGYEISWYELASEIDVTRAKQNDLLIKVQKLLELNKGGYLIELFHKPGAGGTTLSRRIAFDFHNKYPTVLITKYIREKTNEALFELAEICQKPILAIVEGYQVTQNELSALIRKTNMDKKHVVFLYVLRTFRQRPDRDQSRLTFLNDKMLDLGERRRFTEKYTTYATDITRDQVKQLDFRDINECEVIDFPLSAYEDEFLKQTIEHYVLSYLNKLPANQLQFTGFAALIYYYSQKGVSDLWVHKLFYEYHLHRELKNVGFEDRFIKKLLIEEYDDNFEPTGYWRPRFNRFATIILSLTLVGLDVAKTQNWKDFLSTWSVDFITECKRSNEYLTDDLRSTIKSLFLNRDNEDIIGRDEDYEGYLATDKKFARLIGDIPDKEAQLRIFQTLTTCYPSESHFKGHLGRFLYETATEVRNFEEAEEIIQEAIELGEHDYNLWHLKGMCNRRRVEFIIRSNFSNYDDEEMTDLEHIVQELTERACEDFKESRKINAYNLHSHISEAQLLIKVLNFGKQIQNNNGNEEFLVSRENAWYENNLNEVLGLLDEANYIIDLYKDLEQSKVISRSRNMMMTCEANIFSFTANFHLALDKFKQLSENADSLIRPYFRKMYVLSLLAVKAGTTNWNKINSSWNKFNEAEFREIKKRLEQNIKEQPRNPSNFRLWLQAVRGGKNFTSLEDSLAVVKLWYDNSIDLVVGHIEASYYMYVFNACMAINDAGSASEEYINRARKYIDECKEKAINDKFSFEWYGSGNGIKKLVSHREVGLMSSEKGFFDDVSRLELVEGVITSVYNSRQGRIRLKCGLDVFFVPAKGGFTSGDETTDVEFYLSFRYTGLHAWEVQRIIKKKPVKPLTISETEIEGFDQIFESEIEIPEPITATPDNVFQISGNKLPGPKILGSIDLTQFEKYKKKKNK
jgi:hypothetical protein